MFGPIALSVRALMGPSWHSQGLPEADMAREGHGRPRDSSDRFPRAKRPPLPTAPSRDGSDHDAVLSIALALGAVLVFVLILYMAS
jgi:hypothetical protein